MIIRMVVGLIVFGGIGYGIYYLVTKENFSQFSPQQETVLYNGNNEMVQQETNDRYDDYIFGMKVPK
jgi:hypothetical protein